MIRPTAGSMLAFGDRKSDHITYSTVDQFDSYRVTLLSTMKINYTMGAVLTTYERRHPFTDINLVRHPPINE